MISAFAIAVAALALTSQVPPVYTSTAVLCVGPSGPAAVAASANVVLTSLFDARIETQTALICTPRVAEAAVRRPAWLATAAWPSLPDDARPGRFLQSLSATRLPQSGLIRVSFTDPDPVVAAAGVTAALEAFTDLSREPASATSPRLARLVEQRAAQEAAWLGAQQQVVDRLKASGVPDIAVELDRRVKELGVLEEIEIILEMRLATARDRSDEEEDEAIAAAIARFRQSAADAQRPTGRTPVVPAPRRGGPSPAELREELAKVRSVRERAKAEAVTIGRIRLEVQAMQERADEALRVLAETDGRIAKLEAEADAAAAIDRVVVVSPPDVPTVASNRPDRIWLGSLSAAGGFLFALVLGAAIPSRLASENPVAGVPRVPGGAGWPAGRAASPAVPDP